MEILLISLCIVAKNEEKTLSSCINSVKKIVDEVIVVDTGSSDNTPEIARKHDAKLVFHQFNDDFSEVRNISLKHATKDWILVLDADEIIDERALCTLKALIETKDPSIYGYYFWCHNYFGDGTFNTFEICRLFRNKPEIYFQRIVHETLQPSIKRAKGKTETKNVVIHHFPFKKKGRFAERSDFYLRLVKKQLELTPSDTLYAIFLAIEYAARKQYDKARTICSEYLNLDPDKAATLHLILAQIYRRMNLYHQSIELIHKSLRASSNQKQLVAQEFSFNFLAMVYFDCGNFESGIKACERAIEINPNLPQFYLNLGILHEKIGNSSEAQTNYLKAYDLNPMLGDQRIYSDEPFDTSNLIQDQLISPVSSVEPLLLEHQG